MHISCQAVCRVFYPPYTYIVTQHTPADTFQITMPGTPTSPPPRALPEARQRRILVLPLLATRANQMLTNNLQEHLRLDALPEARSRHVPVKTANQTLTNKLQHHLIRLDALPKARRRHVLPVILVTTVNWTLLTDQGRRSRPTTRDSMRRRQQQQVERNSRTTQKMKSA